MDGIHSMSDVESPVQHEIGPQWKVWHVGGDLDLNAADALYRQERYTATKIVANAPVANPAPLALFAFGFMTAMLQGATTTITDNQPTLDFTACFAIFFGGLMPFIAGMWEMWKNNSFAAVAFMSYGGFWFSWGLYMILKSANIWTGQSSNTPIPDYNLAKTEEMILSLWGIITFCFFIQTLRINRVLQVVFFSLMVLFFLSAGGIRSETCNKVAGWWGMWVALICFYAATAILTVDVWGHEYLPLWHVNTTPPAPTVQRSVASVASSADRNHADNK